jgi:imidazole glycerol-phosphate synthase subunit HisF
VLRPRIIPVLLLRNNVLVKTIGFKNEKYIGDPINAVHIYNDLHADELVFLDIDATVQNRLIDIDFVRKIGEEADMPFAVGGGIRTVEHIRDLISAGAEKVVISTYALENPNFIRMASDEFGASTIAVCMDIKKKFLGTNVVWTHGGKKSSSYKPIDFARLMEEKGAGEIIVQSIDKDGSMSGYDIELIRSIVEAVTIPVVALGGAGTYEDLKIVREHTFANGLAAGSLFVYQSKRRGVLINYPEKGKRRIEE